MTLNGFPYSITELLLLLRQLPIASVTLLLWSAIAETIQRDGIIFHLSENYLSCCGVVVIVVFAII